MSTTLYWKPVRPEKPNTLGDQIKYILAKVYWDHDGTCYGEEVTITTDVLGYLSGIRDGSRDKEVKRDCDMLIKVIQQYGSIRIWIE